MTPHPSNSSQLGRYIVDSLFLALPLTLLIVSISVFPLKIALTVALLVFSWSFDAFMKRVLGLGTESMFADLSFASFMFVGSYGISTFSINTATTMVRGSSIVQLALITAAFGGGWFINLTICRGFKNLQGWQLSILNVASFIIGVASAGVVIYLQFQGVL